MPIVIENYTEATTEIAVGIFEIFGRYIGQVLLLAMLIIVSMLLWLGAIGLVGVIDRRYYCCLSRLIDAGIPILGQY
jgi:hypothetical protein